LTFAEGGSRGQKENADDVENAPKKGHNWVRILCPRSFEGSYEAVANMLPGGKKNLLPCWGEKSSTGDQQRTRYYGNRLPKVKGAKSRKKKDKPTPPRKNFWKKKRDVI